MGIGVGTNNVLTWVPLCISLFITIIRFLGRVSSDTQKRAHSRQTRLQREHKGVSEVSEWAKWVSEPMNGASKGSEQAKQV